jgi:hypothetical protein
MPRNGKRYLDRRQTSTGLLTGLWHQCEQQLRAAAFSTAQRKTRAEMPTTYGEDQGPGPDRKQRLEVPECYLDRRDPRRSGPLRSEGLPHIGKLLCCRAWVRPQLTAVRFPILSETEKLIVVTARSTVF